MLLSIPIKCALDTSIEVHTCTLEFLLLCSQDLAPKFLILVVTGATDGIGKSYALQVGLLTSKETLFFNSEVSILEI